MQRASACRKDTITAQLLSCLRKGSSAEATLAVQGLGLHVLSLGLGPDTDRFLSTLCTLCQGAD